MPNQSICQRLDLIQNYTDTLETEANDTQNMITNVNISLQERFDAVDGNLTEIDNTLTSILGNISNLDSDVQALVNCTASPNAPICTKLDNITSITTEINTTLTIVSDVVNYINSTRWGNFTAQDIYDLIDTTRSNTNTIITKVRQLREFEEEAVFLVTDSFGLQEEAGEQLRQGNTDAAIVSLKEANQKLKEAAVRLEALQSDTQAELQKESNVKVSETSWLPLVTFLVVVSCVISYFYFTKKK